MTGAGGVGGLLSTTYQGVTYQVCCDANGNVTGLVPVSGTGAGTLVARFDYDPFGNRVTNAGPSVELCPFGFSTKYLDPETGVVSYELRGYLPGLGRWMSRDLMEEVGGVNLYKAAGNDTINHIDYLGLTMVGDVINEFLTLRWIAWSSPYAGGMIPVQDPGEKLWIMPTNDQYTGIVRRWNVVKNKIAEIEKEVSLGPELWEKNRATTEGWKPSNGINIKDPNAEKYHVPNPEGTDALTAATMYAVWKTTTVQTDALHTAAIGSFDLYVTMDSFDKSTCSATMNIWMFNRMSKESFGPWVNEFPFGDRYQRHQYMWWNWKQTFTFHK